MNALQKIRQLVDEIQASANPAESQAAWDLVQRLLGRMPIDQSELERTCKEHDAARLDTIVSSLENPKEAAPTEGATFSDDDLAAALRAFRKRLKVMRLADESKLGGRQLSGGRKSEIDAIIPPTDFPAEIWRELAKSGRLKNTGQGFYSLA